MNNHEDLFKIQRKIDSCTRELNTKYRTFLIKKAEVSQLEGHLSICKDEKTFKEYRKAYDDLEKIDIEIKQLQYKLCMLNEKRLELSKCLV